VSANDDDALLADDAAAREAALDVGRSFVVQAPAGSGKTELLVQRLLALLAIVDRPESVLAITFSRKAAAEMRARVVEALVAAGDAEQASDLPPHRLRTRELARLALERDAELGWNLIRHPSRLAVRTIDALAQAIALQAPLASGLPANPRFTEAAGPLHLAAAHAAIRAAASDDPRWRSLLDHQDNDADALAQRVAELLERRDQWRALVAHDAGEVRAVLEQTLAEEVAGECAQLGAVVSAADWRPLPRLARSVLAHLGPGDEDLRGALEACADAGTPPLDGAHLERWRAIARWLLNQKGALRKLPTKMRGVPAAGDGPGKAERQAHAGAIRAWLEALGATPGLGEALARIAMLPPLRYRDEEWARVEALRSLLPEFAAHLEVEFARAREFDFPKGTLASLAALGERDAPGDILLRLDLRIAHLLVDEFQDTSFAHLDLIGRLVAGWSEGDGRTLFAVGDPMQSIYRFRGAEVRAFVDATAAGAIEGVRVERLTLRRNFRSQEGLVRWVNDQFPAVLGSVDDPWQGRVGFARAIAARPAGIGEAVTLDLADDEAAEAALVVARVKEARGRGERVAILVRTRTHLGAVLPALRDAGIVHAAVDVDALADRPAGRDVASLAQALMLGSDRLAWLSVLRAPWCGLSLADMHALVAASDAEPGRALADVVQHPPDSLSEEGRRRLARCAAVLVDARRSHGLAPLAERVRRAWLALGGPATLRERFDLAAVDEVFALIAEHERAGEILDWNAFTARLAGERLAPPAGAEADVQVMTMHKAKGLEFDTVILPGLACARRGPDHPFVRWRTRRNGLMVGLAGPKGGEADGVYAYLGMLGGDENDAELARLAYVACTRARHHLALVACLSPESDRPGWRAPGRGSILALFDPAKLGLVLERPEGGPSGAERPVDRPPSMLERLPADWRTPAAPRPLAAPTPPRAIEPKPPFDWVRERARRLGVVVHRMLAQVAADGLALWDEARLAERARAIEAALVDEGALPQEASREARDVTATLAATLADPRGRWLFDPAHRDARSEWALTGVDGGEVVHVVLDRSFVAEGVRWIVDFKTGSHEGGDPEAFLDAEVERYRAQLERYGRVVRELDRAHPVALALYHPRVPGGWRVVR